MAMTFNSNLMKPLITGSLAYDYLMRIHGRFADRLSAAPDGVFHAAYVAPSLRKLFGGCAANIAYALRKLGDDPVLMATAGGDFAPYRDYLRGHDINIEHVLELADFYTAQAYISTDDDDNQFIVFYPGATAEAQRQSIATVAAAITPPLAIVAPNGKEGMCRHCRELATQQTPFLFDPGQAIGLFSGEELLTCMRQCTYAIFNAGEFAVLQNATGAAATALAAMVDALIITHGEDGSEIIFGDRTLRAACIRVGDTRDPTGCGDAYRAGIMHGLMRGWEWEHIIVHAAAVAGIKAANYGGNGYELSPAKVQELCGEHGATTTATRKQ